MDHLYKDGLSQTQRQVMDTFDIDFDYYNQSVVDEVSIVCHDIIGRTFMSPDEIEDAVRMEEEIFSIEQFRTLRAFRLYMEKHNISSAYSTDQIEHFYRIIYVGQEESRLKQFFSSTERDWEEDIKEYIRLFEMIEYAYEIKTGEPLSFKGLEQPVGYDEHLGF